MMAGIAPEFEIPDDLLSSSRAIVVAGALAFPPQGPNSPVGLIRIRRLPRDRDCPPVFIY